MKKHINPDSIVPSISGRLGNNMFMIAHAYAKAIEHNRQLVVPKDQVSHMKDFSTNIFRKIDLYLDMPHQTEYNTVFGGYFQSETYFKKYSETIKHLYSPTLEFLEKAYTKYSFLDKPTTCIHVRRGDYLHYNSYHPVITREYIDEAIKKIDDTNAYLVFGDDRNWCIENLSHLPSVHFIQEPTHEEMWLMSLCDNFVLSNSSFGWWGAYLSRNKNKIVVVPETWYGPNGPINWEEIYCEEWIKLPTYYENGFIYPKL
jgi:hypothetical protein